MEWIYVDDELPKNKGDFPPTCLVSAKNNEGKLYVTNAAYSEDGWIDTELRSHNVYAWCIPSPAPEKA